MRSTTLSHLDAWVWAACVACVLSAGGCTFSDGDPWGRLDLSAQARLEDNAGRFDASGALLTPQNVRVALERLDVTFASVEVIVNSVDAGPTGFDPANPPAGYSLCHNGHCHRDDGALVDYEDIEAELAVGAGGGGAPVGRVIDAAVALSRTPQALPMEPCVDDCELGRGQLGAARLTLTRLTLTGRAYPIDPALSSLPEAGVEVALDLPLQLVFAIPLEGRIDDGEPVGVDLALDFVLTTKLLDGLDWERLLDGADPQGAPVALGEDPETTALILESLEGASVLSAQTTRVP